jgi:hypothetical protein
VSDRRTIVLDERDIVLLASGSKESLHAAVSQLYQLAQQRVAQSPDKVDRETGELEPRTWRFIFGEDTEDITTKQRGFLHAAVFPQIAEQVVLNGERFAPETWKEHYRRKFLPDRWKVRKLPGAKRATPQRVRVSTEDLSVKQYSEHIDMVIADATVEFGVTFIFNTEEREAVRYRRPSRKRQPEAATAAANPEFTCT